jgi:solute carrier family 25 phosphate transporter 3
VLQVDPAKFKGLVPSIQLIMKEEGAAGIWKGWLPTAIGYSLQGCFKFGLYEFFKDFYSNLAGEEASYTYRGMIYLAGSASAEVFADAALCPMEMVKVRTLPGPHEQRCMHTVTLAHIASWPLLLSDWFSPIVPSPLGLLQVKVQTSPKGTFPVEFFAALSAMKADAANTK